MSAGTAGADRASVVEESVIVLAVRNSLELAIRRRSQRSIGRIITRVDSPDLIAGVMIEPLQVQPDDNNCKVGICANGPLHLSIQRQSRDSAFLS